MRRYEPEVRETMVQRVMSPENVCIATLARETGISKRDATIHWTNIAVRRRNSWRHILVHSGQHYDLETSKMYFEKEAKNTA